MENLIVGKPSSVPVSPEMLKKLNDLIELVLTKDAAAQNIGIGRNTLHLLMKSKTCAPKTLDKINAFFNPEQNGSASETSAA